MAVRKKITAHERLRRKAGYSSTELAKALGVSQAYISRVEGGSLRPSARYREAVAALWGVPVEEIFSKEQERWGNR